LLPPEIDNRTGSTGRGKDRVEPLRLATIALLLPLPPPLLDVVV
jgi:hypothetical protein